MKAFEENTKSHREQKEEILEQQSPNTSTDLPTVPFSDTSAISTPFIFIKSDLRLVIDLQTCIKAQQSGAYAQKSKAHQFEADGSDCCLHTGTWL